MSSPLFLEYFSAAWFFFFFFFFLFLPFLFSSGFPRNFEQLKARSGRRCVFSNEFANVIAIQNETLVGQVIFYTNFFASETADCADF